MRNLFPRNLERALAAAVCAALLASAAHALEVTEWKNRQSLNIETAGLAFAALPDETLDAARADLGDLRVLDPAGREIAFLLRRGARPTVQPMRAKAFHSTLTAGATELTIATSDSAITDVILETPAAEFVKSAKIETSADGRAWQVAEAGAPLFRQRGVEQLRLHVNAPFVRITLDDSRSRPVPFTGARVLPAISIGNETQPVAARIARREEFAGETVLTLDLGAAHGPLESLIITSPERLFTRRVDVGVRELRDESAVEHIMATGTIHASPVDTQARSGNTTVALDFAAPSRELSIHIANDDSPPLAISGVQLSRYEVKLYFDAAIAGDYTLLSGHPQIAAPRYDVSGLRLDQNTRATAIIPGPLAPNPSYRAPDALAGTALAGGAIEPAPWRYRKAVQLAAAGVQQLELDLEVLVHAQPGFADLRLVRDGAQVPYLIERPSLSRSLELAATAAPDPKRPRVSRWEIKLPRAGAPLSRVTLTSPTTLFQRHLRLFEKIADDRGNTYERSLAAADWSHTPRDPHTLTVLLGITPITDVLVLETDNGDNPPLVLGSVVAAYPVTRLLFKTDQPATLYYGNAQASAPHYDLTLVAPQILAADKHVATLGPEEKAKADGWATTALGGARGGIVFWSVLAIVVLALLGVVAKLLPKAPSPSA